MADRKRDELADALARMNAGEELPDTINLDSDEIPPLDFPPPPPPAPAAPPPRSITPPRPTMPRPTPRPTSPPLPTPVPSSTPIQSKPKPRPAPPAPFAPILQVPATPLPPSRPTSKSAPSRRPSTPPRPAGPPTSASSSDQPASSAPLQPFITNDQPGSDDIGFSADPALSEYRPRPDASTTSRTSFHKSLFLRQTLIPILLTLGIGLPTLMSLRFFVDEDSPFAALQLSYTYAAYAVGAILLILAVVNMLHVKSQLAGRKT